MAVFKGKLAKGKYFQLLLRYGNTNPNMDYNALN
jgi:hypothetical protein